MKLNLALLLTIISLSTLSFACGEEGDSNSTGLRASSAPVYLAQDDASTVDLGDFDCHLVLRSVGRVSNGPGYETTCDRGSSDQCLYVWDGVIDVDAGYADQISAVELLYRPNTNAPWYVVETTSAESSAADFDRYTFTLDELTPAAGMSMTSLNNTEISLIPYLVTTQGTRLFDHNRIGDPFGVYTLNLANNWQIEADDACPASQSRSPRYVLDYPDFNESLVDGPLNGGDQLTIDYDIDRLLQEQSCLSGEGMASSTTIKMGYTFGGESYEQSIATYIESYGSACNGESPCVTIQDETPLIEIPVDASSIAMWFYCVPGFSGGAPDNWKYDSNFNNNYVLQVEPGHLIDWAGDWQLRASRSGFTFPIEEPYRYTGFTNMGWVVQAQVFARGLTDQGTLDTSLLKAYVESDLLNCEPGGALTTQELATAETHYGVFGNNVLYRWGFEAFLNQCPKGSYRYRFLFSADGGTTLVPLGNAVDSQSDGAESFRTIISE